MTERTPGSMRAPRCGSRRPVRLRPHLAGPHGVAGGPARRVPPHPDLPLRAGAGPGAAGVRFEHGSRPRTFRRADCVLQSCRRRREPRTSRTGSTTRCERRQDCYRAAVKAADAAVLASILRDHYCPSDSKPASPSPTVIENEHGFRALLMPRKQMSEPFRSIHLLDAVALGHILVVTFRWDDGNDDGTIFLMPLDTRDGELDMSDNSRSGRSSTTTSRGPSAALGRAGSRRPRC